MRYVRGAYIPTITLAGDTTSLVTPTEQSGSNTNEILGIPVDITGISNGKALIYSDGKLVFQTVTTDTGPVTTSSLTLTDTDGNGELHYRSDTETFVFDHGLYTGNGGIFCGGIQSCGGSGEGSYLTDVTDFSMRSSRTLSMNGSTLQMGSGGINDVGFLNMNSTLNMGANLITNIGHLAGFTVNPIILSSSLDFNGNSIKNLDTIENYLSLSGVADTTDSRLVITRGDSTKASWVEYDTPGSDAAWFFGQPGSETGFVVNWWDGFSDHHYLQLDTSGNITTVGTFTGGIFDSLTSATHHITTGGYTPRTNDCYLTFTWASSESTPDIAVIYAVQQGSSGLPITLGGGSNVVIGSLENDPSGSLLQVNGGGSFMAPIIMAQYNVSALPSTAAGSIAYAANGLKDSESTGNGTGIPVWYDGSSWRTFYDNTVAAS
jgi:hypothetical protein